MRFGAMSITEIGIFDSRVKFPKGLHTRSRTVKRYELEIYTTDQPGCTYLNDRQVELKAGTVIVAKPEMVRHSRLPFRCLYMHIKTSDPGLCAVLQSLPDQCVVADVDALASQFRRMLALDPDTFPEEALLLQSRALEFLYRMSRELSTNRADMLFAHRKIMQDTDRFIRENLTQELTLTVLAKHANMSVSYFHKLFSQHFGTPPAEYVSNCRIVAAKTLLTTCDYSMEQIAQLCGFSSQSYFNYRFKQQTGKSPNQYRMESLSGLQP